MERREPPTEWPGSCTFLQLHLLFPHFLSDFHASASNCGVLNYVSNYGDVTTITSGSWMAGGWGIPLQKAAGLPLFHSIQCVLVFKKMLLVSNKMCADVIVVLGIFEMQSNFD